MTGEGDGDGLEDAGFPKPEKVMLAAKEDKAEIIKVADCRSKHIVVRVRQQIE